jgi:hypothetical protein
MKLFDFFKKTPHVPQQTSVDHVQFSLPELPVIRELRGREWIYFGDDNLYPQHLRRIVSQSPTIGSIIKGKAGMMAGDGFLINDTKDLATSNALLDTLPQKEAFKAFIANENGHDDVEEILTKLATDYETFGAFALEVVWSMDFSRIATLKYVDVSNVRSGKMINDKVTMYWYSRDWYYHTKDGFIPKAIAAFDEKNKSDYNQLIYVKAGNLEYYGLPIYSESISYVEIEAKLANFHLSNISQGFAPSMSLKFFQKPDSPEHQRVIVQGINKMYGGVGNAGRAMVFFSDGKDLAPEIAPIPVSDLHNQYMAVNELTIQNILTGSQVTSPLLFGISVPGQLGGSTELDIAYKIFNKSVIGPDRKKLEKILNKILKVNKIDLTISINEYNPLA